MTYADLLRHRLHNQRLTGTRVKQPADVIRWLGAVQAQEYARAKWAVAARTSGATNATLEAMFNAGNVLRTHVMRPTWHFVLPADIRWMLELTAPRVNAACRSRHRQLELDDAVFARSHAVLAKALQGGRTLTRAALGSVLRDAGVTSSRDDKQRLVYIVMRAELDAVICSGPRVDKQFTYALLEERVPHAVRLDRVSARAELARRYFRSHGPATVRDFGWWSGLTVAEARAGLEAVRSALVGEEIDGKTYWRPKRLPSIDARTHTACLLTTWDEYFVGYNDRPAADATRPRQFPRDRGQIIVIDERSVGTWRHLAGRDSVVIEATASSSFSRSDKDDVGAAADRYARFLGVPVRVQFTR